MSGLLTYVVGDATKPMGGGAKAIVHICNDVGAWGAGFVKALSLHWDAPESEYRDLITRGGKLGDIQVVSVPSTIDSSTTAVVNLIGQRDIFADEQGRKPIRYWAVDKGLEKLGKRMSTVNEANASGGEIWTVHMPRIGCGLAGGHWDEIEDIIQRRLISKGLHVTVYDLPEEIEKWRTGE